MILETAAAGAFMKNGYVAGCETTREAILIDPGEEVGQLLAFIEREHLKVRGIFLTHAHVDHVAGVPEAKRALGVPIYLHRDDSFLYDDAISHGQMFGIRIEPLPPVDVFYENGGTYPFGEYDIVVRHTPGHCPGGVCLQVGRRGTAGKDLFVGDTLFAGSIGRTDLPGGNYRTLLTSITDVLFPLGDDAIVYSGHGPVTTIGHERRTNQFLLEWQNRG